MEQDGGLKAGLQGLVDDVKERVREVRESGPRAGFQGVVEDVKGRVTQVIGWLIGRRDEEGVRVGETEQAAQQRLARQSGNADVARASAAKQAAEQQLAQESGKTDVSPARATKRRTDKATKRA